MASRIHTFQRARAIGYAAVSYLLSAACTLTIAGCMLAANPDFGGYSFTTRRPAPNGNLSAFVLINDAHILNDYGRFSFGPHASTPLPPGAIGSARVEISGEMVGFPYHTRVTCSITKLTEVKPGPGGPASTELQAWMDIVSEAASNSPLELSPKLADGLTHTTYHPLNFFRNAAWRLLHEPIWSGVALLVAVGLAIPAFRIARRRWRFIHGNCEICGYDLSGHPLPAICPECGTRARPFGLNHAP